MNELKFKLTPEEEDSLVKSLNDFSSWLLKKKVVKTLAHIKLVVDFPFADEDWVMKLNEENTRVSFNTFVSSKCPFDHYRVIVLHEFFHLAVQKVPNKEDAVRVRDDFGNELMKLIDIEADFYTALFCKQVLSYSLVDYLKLNYQGSKIFSDKRIRTFKLERFIGSILSICKLYLDCPNTHQKVYEYDLYLPSISPIYTENSLHILVIKREHIYFDNITASYDDFVDIKSCYTNIDNLTMKEYVKKLVAFSCKAFQKTIPAGIQRSINKLPEISHH